MAVISIIMGIYNCADTLPEAIDSILNQTFTDWELILCDDGSVDSTFDVAQKYKEQYPDKIVLLKNEKNQGLNATLNHCLKFASGKYIARMDGDDISFPDRLKLEVETLENEKNISIVSCDMSHFDETGEWGRETHPEYPEKGDLIKGTPFCHAPCMVRKEAYDAVEGYTEDEKLLRVEDYHLWYKMYKKGWTGKNIHSVLYSMRDDRNAYSRRKFKYRINEAYVKWLIFKNYHLPWWNILFILRPIIVGMLPGFVYDLLHKKRLG